jgi:hypothetical protein
MTNPEIRKAFILMFAHAALFEVFAERVCPGETSLRHEWILNQRHKFEAEGEAAFDALESGDEDILGAIRRATAENSDK